MTREETAREESAVVSDAVLEELWVGDDLQKATQRAGTSYHTLRYRLVEAGLRIMRPRIIVNADGELMLPPSIKRKLGLTEGE